VEIAASRAQNNHTFFVLHRRRTSFLVDVQVRKTTSSGF